MFADILFCFFGGVSVSAGLSVLSGRGGGEKSSSEKAERGVEEACSLGGGKRPGVEGTENCGWERLCVAGNGAECCGWRGGGYCVERSGKRGVINR